ncbi:unnamed protein product [Discula destructiva]
MCGGHDNDLLDPRRFGALAVVSPSSALELESANLSGHILFFNQSDHKSPMATHVSYTPNETHSCCRDLVLTIFSTGDLTAPSKACKQINRFTLSQNSCGKTANGSTMQLELERDLLLQVGGDGIIGRRIRISTLDSPTSCMAEGVVGFNSGAPLPPVAKV